MWYRLYSYKHPIPGEIFGAKKGVVFKGGFFIFRRVMLIKRQNGFRYTLRIQFVKLLSRDFPLAFVFVAEFWKIDFLQKPKLRVPDGWWYFFPWRSSNFHLVPLFSWVCHIQALLCCVSMPFQRLNIFEKFQMTQKFLLFSNPNPQMKYSQHIKHFLAI